MTKKESDALHDLVSTNPVKMVWDEMDHIVKAKGPTSVYISGNFKLMEIIERIPRECKTIIKAKDVYFK